MTHLNRAELRSRYRITGRLVMDTALHIGGGREASTVTDSPVIRDPAGDPFIPGSSLKGAFRAAIERLAPVLGVRSCQLMPSQSAACLSMNDELSQHYMVVRRAIGRELPDRQETREALDRLQTAVRTPTPDSRLAQLGWPNWTEQFITEDHLLALLDALLCDTCKTFGSVHLASVAFFHDLPVAAETWYGTAQIRDGVGIDRDSERAREQIKFDFEVIPPQTAFRFSLSLENPRDADLGLIAVGLQELSQGMLPLGGIRSRGLGRCHLENVQVRSVDLTNEAARRAYLVSGTLSEQTGAAFIAERVAALFGA